MQRSSFSHTVHETVKRQVISLIEDIIRQDITKQMRRCACRAHQEALSGQPTNTREMIVVMRQEGLDTMVTPNTRLMLGQL